MADRKRGDDRTSDTVERQGSSRQGSEHGGSPGRQDSERKGSSPERQGSSRQGSSREGSTERGQQSRTAGTDRDFDESGESINQGHGHPREERGTHS